MSQNKLTHLIDLGFKAIIFEGTGLGHVGKTMYDAVKKANTTWFVSGNDITVY